MKQQFIIIAAAVSALALGGCSVVSNGIGSIIGKKSQKPAVVTAAEPSAPVIADHSAESLAGRWIISSVGKTQVRGYEDEWPYIEFSPSEGRFYGSDACNVINGDYTVRPGQLLTLDHIATTMRLCPDDTLATPIALALDATRSFSIAKRGGTQILSLHNDRHLTVMTLRNPDIIFLDGPWQVTSIGGKEVDNPDVRLTFDVADGLIHGNTGCNLLNGAITQDPQVTSSVQFSSLVTTRMACAPGDTTEQRLLIALEETATARRGSRPDTAELLSPSGRVLITLSKLSKADL